MQIVLSVKELELVNSYHAADVPMRCSYAVPCGRACASHFDVQNPLEKQIVASKDDPLVPDQYKEKQFSRISPFPGINQSKLESRLR